MSDPAAIDHDDRQVVSVPRWMMLECGGDSRDAMVLAQVAFWYQPPLDGSREHRSRSVVARDGHDWIALVDEELAEQLGMTRSQVQRARKALAGRGLIETKTAKVSGERRTLVRPVIQVKRENAHRHDEGTGLCAEVHNGSKREVARIRTRATPAAEDQPREQPPAAKNAAGDKDLFGDDVPEPTEAKLLTTAARDVATAVFDRRRPKPAQPFPAVMAVAKALVKAGHEPDAVVAAMVEDGAMTIAAVEFRLGRARERLAATLPPEKPTPPKLGCDVCQSGVHAEAPAGHVTVDEASNTVAPCPTCLPGRQPAQERAG